MNTRRRRSASRGLLIAVLVVGVLVAGLFAADRYVLGRVEREAAVQLQDDLGTPAPPAVDIAGWPFLTQVASRQLDSVRVVADDVGTNGGSAVRVAHTDLVLSEVTSNDGFRSLTAERAEGTARIDYADLGGLSAVPLTYAGDGRMRVEVATGVFGLDVQAVITGTPRLDVDAQAITLADPEIDVGDVGIPQSTAEALMGVLLKPIPVTGLPFGLTLTSVSAQDDGLHVGLQGEDVQLSR